MTGKSPVQITVQRGTFNITLSGDTVAEVDAQVQEAAASLVDSLLLIDQAIVAKSPTNPVVVGTPDNIGSALVKQVQQLSSPPPQAGGSCEDTCGPRVTKSGEKNGKAWRGQFCASNNKSHAPLWG